MKKLGLLCGSLALFATTGLLATGCVTESAEIDEENVSDSMSWEEFQKVVFQEPETGVYIANGDEAFENIEALERFYLENIQQGALAVYNTGGKDIKWSASQALNLTYCVSTKFNGNHAKVVSAMNTATSAWEGVAKVNFVYLSAEDANCTAQNKNVVFDVNPVNVGGQYLARSFFPNSSRNSRNVLIDNSVWTSGIGLDGILRHELGHTLGFRHEHTRPEAGACFEDNQWRALTPYDSSSVMHYPQCNGTNTWNLNLTNQDKAGAASLYGAP